MKKMLLVVSMVFAFTASAAQAQITLMDQIGVNPTTLNGGAVAASQRFSDFPTFDIASGDNSRCPPAVPYD